MPRSASGYRVYDDRMVGRLRLIARAKELDLSLDEIAELAHVWDRDQCSSVQARLVDLIDDKTAQARGRVAELEGFVRDLDAARSSLGLRTADGPCDDQCGCTTEHAPSRVAPVALSPNTDLEEVPVACTLDGGELRNRIGAWHELLREATHVQPLPTGGRVWFEPQIDAAAVAELAAKEQRCCAFLSFSIAIGRDAVMLEVHGPPDTRPVVDTLLGLAR